MNVIAITALMAILVVSAVTNGLQLALNEKIRKQMECRESYWRDREDHWSKINREYYRLRAEEIRWKHINGENTNE